MKISTLDRKKFRVRNKLKKVSSKDRFRLCVSRSTKNISAQIIDDVNKTTLVSASSLEKNIRVCKNIKKSLVRNGRLTFVCWSNREENDWINLSSNVASQFLELPPKANPKDPGPFAFEDYFYIKEILMI